MAIGLPATIRTLVRQFHSAPTPENICGSSVRVMFSYNTGTAPYILEFSKGRRMESAGFWQVCEFDVSPERLSMRRQNAQFGFVNAESFLTVDETESVFNRGIARKRCISASCIFTFRII
jgi:hypothetical protein